ncbi:uncharacterized protein [Diadema antillarum]|uniref:uncharacterized protein n=1 Tax=Diadema antillarum TaxID=105358 RepID=UPI003A87DD4F
MNMADEDQDNDVPPLEDMSELIQQAQTLQLMKEEKEAKPRLEAAQSGLNPSKASTSKSVECSGKMQATGSETVQQNSSSREGTSSQKTRTAKADSFGGMKKGFLFGAPAVKSKSASQKPKQTMGENSKPKTSAAPPLEDDIPLIKPKGDAAQSGAQKIFEVQEALKASAPFLQNKDWITGDLLSKIEKNPHLARQMADPRFSQAMAMFQTNPQAAMQHFQSSPDIQQFFKEFCEILGNHFSNMGGPSAPVAETEPGVIVHDPKSAADISVSSSTNPNQPTAADEAQMQEILAKPEVVKAFGDPQIRALIEKLRTDPEEAQRMMRAGSAEFKQNIQTLVNAGLLGFAR